GAVPDLPTDPDRVRRRPAAMKEGPMRELVTGCPTAVRSEVRVLVVEDEPDMVVTYERLLRRHGYRVESATTRAGGLTALARDAPALLISALRLADGDGLDVVRQARALPSPPVVIVVTGFGSAALQEAARAAGASAFVTKPFSTEAFVGVIRA